MVNGSTVQRFNREALGRSFLVFFPSLNDPWVVSIRSNRRRATVDS